MNEGQKRSATIEALGSDRIGLGALDPTPGSIPDSSVGLLGRGPQVLSHGAPSTEPDQINYTWARDRLGIWHKARQNDFDRATSDCGLASFPVVMTLKNVDQPNFATCPYCEIKK